MNFKWDTIPVPNCFCTFRAKVFGGWIIRCCDVNEVNSETTSESMVFVPDPEHKWKIS